MMKQKSRRAFVGLAGGLAVVAAGGAALRVADLGYLDDDVDPYRLWDDIADSAKPRDLVAAAVLAANPHNSQPWKFRAHAQSVDVLIDRTRALGPADPFLRQMHIAIGCAVENLCVAARAHGISPSVELWPDPASPDVAAHIALAREGSIDARHAAVIRKRHTNRGPYDRHQPIPDAVRDSLDGQSSSTDASLQLFDASSARGDLFKNSILTATASLIADDEFMRVSDSWFRWTPREVCVHGDGPSLHAAGLSPLTEAAAVMGFRPSPNRFNQAWQRTTRDVHLSTAPMFGLITTPLDSHAQHIEAGRLWQRLQLEATVHGLAMQPLDQAIEASERARELGASLFGMSAKVLSGSDCQLAMMFRVGYPVRPGRPSARRPLIDVLA